MKINQLQHTFPDSQPIFSVDEKYSYHIATRISDVFEEKGELCLETTLTNFQKATLRISLVDNFAIRIKYSQKYFPEKIFSDHIENKKYSLPKYRIEKSEVEAVEAAEVKAMIATNETGTLGKKTLTEKIIIDFKDGKKELVFTKNPLNIEIIDKKTKQIQFSLNWREGFSYFGGFTAPGLGFKQIDDDVFLPFLSFAIRNDELIYGLGEKFSSLVKNGTRKTIWNTDTSGKTNSDLSYSSIPFLSSNFNWGLLLDTGFKSYFEIASSVNDAGTILNTSQFLDLYLFAGDNIKEITQDYTKLTGKIKGVLDRAYGVWYSRLYYYDRKDVFEQIDLSKKHNFPMDVIHVDPKWLKNRYTKSCNFVEADERFGDFKKFYKDCQKEDVSISLWINPYIQGDDSQFFKTALKNNYLVKSTKGGLAHPYTGVEVYQSDNYLIDLTNPLAYKWYKEHLKVQLKKGAHFFVNDYGDGVPAEALFHNGKTGIEMRQYYMFLYNKISFEASAEVFGKENTANISRPGYISSHKYPGKWGGDSLSRWSELKSSIQAGLSLSFNGEQLWGTDIGGFLGNPTSQLYIRWIQYGSFTPFTRMHGITKREPWYFSNQVIEISRKYLELKRQWFPEYKIGEFGATKNGVPTMRPLVFEFEKDLIASKIDDQFLINDNVMVVPILKENQTQKQIYFPEGTWIDYFNHSKKYSGLTNHNVNISIEDMPIFVKAGTVLVTFEKGNFQWKDIYNQKIILNVFLGDNGKGQKDFIFNKNKVSITWEIKNDKYKVDLKGYKNFKINIIK